MKGDCAGMEKIKSPHDIRRAVLTDLYRAGVPLTKIQYIAGHSTLRQTTEYICLAESEIDSSIMDAMRMMPSDMPMDEHKAATKNVRHRRYPVYQTYQD